MQLNIIGGDLDLSKLLQSRSRKERRIEETRELHAKQKEKRKLLKDAGISLKPKASAKTTRKSPTPVDSFDRRSTAARKNEEQYLKSTPARKFDKSGEKYEKTSHDKYDGERAGRERNRDYGRDREEKKKKNNDDDYWGEPEPKKNEPKKNRDYDGDSGSNDYSGRRDASAGKDRRGPKKHPEDKNKRKGKKTFLNEPKKLKPGEVVEALPTTTNREQKATTLTKEDKILEQRIGQDTALLSQSSPFADLGVSPRLVKHLESIKFTQPTQIQAQAIPALLSGRDALCQAQTGSGKTLAYLLPVLQNLSSHAAKLTRDDGTHAIVLAPTRELVLQIEEVWAAIAKPFYWLIATTIMGGAKKKSEKARLRAGCHVVIGTPGRIVDHLGSTKSWTLGSVRWLILDEADRLLDLGFKEPIRTLYEELLERADQRPQCALVSATLSQKQIREGVFELSSLLLQNPVHVGFEGVQDIEDEEAQVVDGKDLMKNAVAGVVGEDDDEDDDSGSDVEMVKQEESSDSDSDDDDIRKRLLSSATTLLRKKIQSSSSSSDSDDDSGSESDDDSNSYANGEETKNNMAMNKLLPRLREKSMDHLGDTSRHTTTQEEQEALDTITTQFVVPKTLEQLYVSMSSRHRLVALSSFLRLRVFNAEQQGKTCKMIVFVSTCASVEFLHRIFQHAYWPDDSVNLTGKVIDDAQAMYENHDDSEGDDEEMLEEGLDEQQIKKLHKQRDKKKKEKRELKQNAAFVQQMKGAQQGRGVKDALVNTQLWKLHGNMPQHLRTETFKRFCDAKEGILFSTDVAARGLDLPLIDWIVQYDPPEDTEDYVHRVGRTARIGHSGRAILFLLESELSYVNVLQKMGTNLKEIGLATLLSGLHVGLPSKSPLLQTERPLGAILQKQFEKLTTLSQHLNVLAKASYIAYVRAYAAYPKALKGIFHPRRLHLGEVAHSFALTETPSEITKHSSEIIRVAEATINPMKAQREQEGKDQKARTERSQKSLSRIAKKTEKRQALSEFL